MSMTVLKRSLSQDELARAESLRNEGKSIEQIADALDPAPAVTYKPMTKKIFAAGAKVFDGWMEGNVARFPSVHQKQLFETWLKQMNY